MFALSGFLCFYLPRAHKNHRRHLFKMHIICVSDVLFDDVRVVRLVFWCALSVIQSIYIYMEVFNAHYLRSHVCYTMHRHSCIYPTNMCPMYAFFCSYCVLLLKMASVACCRRFNCIYVLCATKSSSCSCSMFNVHQCDQVADARVKRNKHNITIKL